MQRLQEWCALSAAACGILMVALAFAPWVSFRPVDAPDVTSISETSATLAGTNLSRARDLEIVGRDDVQTEQGWCSCSVARGDGYITAALGALITVSAVVAYLTWLRAAGLFIAMAGFAAFALGAYNAVADWNALAYTTELDLHAVDGSITWGLWLTMTVAVAGAAAGGALVAMGAGKDEDEPEGEDGFSEMTIQGMQPW